MNTADVDIRFGSGLGPLFALDQLIEVEPFFYKKQCKLERFELISGAFPLGEWKAAEGPLGPRGGVIDPYLFRLRISSNEPIVSESGWWDSVSIRWIWRDFGELRTIHNFNDDPEWEMSETGGEAAERLLKAAVALRRRSNDLAPFSALAADKSGKPDNAGIQKVYDAFLEAAEREQPAVGIISGGAAGRQIQTNFGYRVFLDLPLVDHFEGVVSNTPGIIVRSASIAGAKWTPGTIAIPPVEENYYRCSVAVDFLTTENTPAPSEVVLQWSWREAGDFVAKHNITTETLSVTAWMDEPAGFNQLRKVYREYEADIDEMELRGDSGQISEDFRNIDPLEHGLPPGMANVFARVRLKRDLPGREAFAELERRWTEAGLATKYSNRSMPQRNPKSGWTRLRTSIGLPAPEGAKLENIVLQGANDARINSVKLGPKLGSVECWDPVDETLRTNIEAKGEKPLLDISVDGPASMASESGAIQVEWSKYGKFHFGVEMWVDTNNTHSTE